MRNKPQPSSSKPQSKKDRSMEEFLKHLEWEREMIDDHGPAIIGKRDMKPLPPESPS